MIQTLRQYCFNSLLNAFAFNLGKELNCRILFRGSKEQGGWRVICGREFNKREGQVHLESLSGSQVSQAYFCYKNENFLPKPIFVRQLIKLEMVCVHNVIMKFILKWQTISGKEQIVVWSNQDKKYRINAKGNGLSDFFLFQKFRLLFRTPQQVTLRVVS